MCEIFKRHDARNQDNEKISYIKMSSEAYFSRHREINLASSASQ